jgi:hypothetical protein
MDFPAFFDEAQEVGSLVLWGGAGAELGNTSSAAYVVPALTRQNGLRFAAQVGYQNDGTPFDAERQAKALLDLRDYVKAIHPEYLVLGVELDRAEEAQPGFLDDFAPWYDQAYDLVKEESPETLVFPSFQLERISGRTGGLYGGSDASAPKWDLVSRFPQRDLTAFTTYPGLVFRDPEDIPADYYTEAKRLSGGGPMGFTEVGHFAELAGAPGWGSSPEEQRAFVERFLLDAATVDARLAIWIHLHDQERFPLASFQHMGLYDEKGEKRPAYEAWSATKN